MISILKTIQSRVPVCSSTTEPDKVCYNRTLLGGDQLSTAMARRVIAERKNSTNTTEALQGVITQSCAFNGNGLSLINTWQLLLFFLNQSVMKLLFDESSFRQKGTHCIN